MKGYRGAVVAVVAALAAAGAGAQQMPQDPIAAANVAQSQRYEALVHGNPTFRAKRIAEECDPIGDPQLHAECVASFGPAPAMPAPPPRR
ncbi:MAG TPA: hypothetical protein VGR91_07260 [Stellaceae bacterium]|nr:hypothetical protein [Stellaceae bacterium]